MGGTVNPDSEPVKTGQLNKDVPLGALEKVAKVMLNGKYAFSAVTLGSTDVKFETYDTSNAYEHTSTLLNGKSKTRVTANLEDDEKIIDVVGTDGVEHYIKRTPELCDKIAAAMHAIKSTSFTAAEAAALKSAHEMLVGSMKPDGKFDKEQLPNVMKAYDMVIAEGKKGL